MAAVGERTSSIQIGTSVDDAGRFRCNSRARHWAFATSCATPAGS
jgi:hypothetical protein